MWKHADAEWKYSKSYYQVQFLAPRAVLPPPLRSFYYFAKFVRWIRTKPCSCCWRSGLCCYVDKEKEKETDVKNDHSMEYLKTLLKLVKSKQHSDLENSTEDNFRDLRQDIQNIVCENGEKIKPWQTTKFEDLKKVSSKNAKELFELNKTSSKNSNDLELVKEELKDIKSLLGNLMEIQKSYLNDNQSIKT